MCAAAGLAKTQESAVKSTLMARDSKGHGCGGEDKTKECTDLYSGKERSGKQAKSDARAPLVVQSKARYV